jgi:gamma-D-glutamyl-L-lysine dipeptidyl-peptidase
MFLSLRCRNGGFQQNNPAWILLILVKTFLNMEYAVIVVPAAPVRRRANHRKEMVNQLLFGETVQLLKTKGDLWVKVRSQHDHYEGWVTRNMIRQVNQAQSGATSEYVTTEKMTLLMVNEIPMYVPVGSSLPGLQDGKGMLGDLGYRVDGNYVNRFEKAPDGERLLQFSSAWLNTPYLWGGRTPLGVDCSGFVQVNFKMLGIDLPRDAWQQAQEGRGVKKLKDAQAGDLAFFDDKEEIVHVGILLSPEQIIHASGNVRIDAMDKKGIIHADTGKRTHRLRAIRRNWN